MRYRHALILFCLLAAPRIAVAELLLAAPPRVVERAGLHAVEEFASYLSVSIGKPVQFSSSVDELEFANRSRTDDFDFVLDEAHMTAWRVTRLNHTPLLQIGPPTRSVVLSRRDDPHVFSVADLSGRTLCAKNNHDIGLHQFLGRWIRPFAGPQLRVVSESPLSDSRCDAAIVTYIRFSTLDVDAASRILTVTPDLPGLSLSAAARVDADIRARTIAEFQTPFGREVVAVVNGETDGALPAPAVDSHYTGLERFVPAEYRR